MEITLSGFPSNTSIAGRCANIRAGFGCTLNTSQIRGVSKAGDEVHTSAGDELHGAAEAADEVHGTAEAANDKVHGAALRRPLTKYIHGAVEAADGVHGAVEAADYTNSAVKNTTYHRMHLLWDCNKTW